MNAAPTPMALRASWATVIVLALGTFATGTDGFVIAGILPSIADSLQVSRATAGQLVTAFAVAYALGSPVLMTLIQGRSIRRLLWLSMVLFTVANVLAALSTSFAALAAARVAAALLAGVYVPTAAAAASLLVPEQQRGRALAVVLGGASLATVVGVPVGVLIEDRLSWQATFVFVAVLGAVALVGILARLPELGTVSAVSLATRLRLLRDPRVILTVLVTVAAMTAGFTIYTYVQPLFQTTLDATAVEVGTLILVFGLGSLVGSWLGGRLVDGFDSGTALLGALTVFAANFALLSVSSAAIVSAYVFMFVWGVTGWGFVPIQQYRLIGFAPNRAPLALSLNASAMYLGIALGAVVGGVATAASPRLLWAASTGAAVVALALAVVSVVVARRVGHRTSGSARQKAGAP